MAPPMKAAAPTTAYEDRLTGRLLPLRRTIARIICPVILPPAAQVHGWVLLSAQSREHGAGEGQLLGFGVVHKKQSGRHFAASYHCLQSKQQEFVVNTCEEDVKKKG